MLVDVLVQVRVAQEGRKARQMERRVEADGGGVDLAPAGFQINAGFIAGFKYQTTCNVVTFVVVNGFLVQERILEEDFVVHRTAGGNHRGIAFVISNRAFNDRLLPVGGLAGGDDYGTGSGVTSIQRALGAFQNFDLAEV